MSALLALILVGGAIWFVVVKAGIHSGAVREPMDSVSEFARAMTALDPTAPPLRRQAAAVRPRPRPPARRPAGAVRPLHRR